MAQADAPAPSLRGDTSPISRFPRGAVVEVVDIESDEPDGTRLKRLGVCVGRKIQVAQTGDPLVLRVVGSRVGLSRRLAEAVLVRPCEVCGVPPIGPPIGPPTGSPIGPPGRPDA